MSALWRVGRFDSADSRLINLDFLSIFWEDDLCMILWSVGFCLHSIISGRKITVKQIFTLESCAEERLPREEASPLSISRLGVIGRCRTDVGRSSFFVVNPPQSPGLQMLDR